MRGCPEKEKSPLPLWGMVGLLVSSECSLVHLGSLPSPPLGHVGALSSKGLLWVITDALISTATATCARHCPPAHIIQW